MADVTGVTVRQAAPGEIPQVVDVLARAFAADRLSVAAVGDPPDPVPVLRTVFGALLRRHYLPRGVVDVAVADGRVLGAAVWSPPGAADLSLGATARLVADLAPRLGARFLPMALHELRVTRVHPRRPHWYLFAIGVGDTGRGVGGLLLDAALRRAGDDPCYLEASTPHSARLYARKGFVEIGRAPAPRGCDPQPQMWRDGGLDGTTR